MNKILFCLSFFIFTPLLFQNRLIAMKALTKKKTETRDSHQRPKSNHSILVASRDKNEELYSKCEGQHRSIFHAISENCIDCVAFFVEKGDVKKWREKSPHYPVDKACCEGRIEIARFLLQNGAKLNNKGERVRHLLWRSLAHDKIIQLLIQRYKEIGVTIDYNDLLYRAVKNGHEATACFLIQNYKNTSKALDEAQEERSCPLIVIAAQHGLNDVVSLICKIFINNPELIDKAGHDDLTALSYALKNGYGMVVNTLLEAGAQFKKIPNHVKFVNNAETAQLLDLMAADYFSKRINF